ncbi:MAG: biotin/lipoyl-binding protein [Bacillota bacterium]
MSLITKFKTASKKKRVLIVIAIIIVLVAAGWGGYALFAKKAVAPEVAKPIKADKKIVATGTIVPIRYTALTFAGSGLIEKIYVAEGQRVKADTLMVQLDNRDQMAKVATCEANLRKAQAALEIAQAGERPQVIAQKQALLRKTQVGYDNAKTDFDRSSTLFAKGGLSPADMDVTRANLANAESALESAKQDLIIAQTGSRPEDVERFKADVYAAQTDLSNARGKLTDLQLRAPFDGMVAYLKFHEGEFANRSGSGGDALNSSSDTSTSLQFADTSKWQAQTSDLSEMDIAKVRAGAKAVITIDALPDLKLNGVVASIRPFGENKNGDMTYTVLVDIDGNNPQIKWNMKCSVTIDPS